MNEKKLITYLTSRDLRPFCCLPRKQFSECEYMKVNSLHRSLSVARIAVIMNRQQQHKIAQNVYAFACIGQFKGRAHANTDRL